MKDVQRTSGEKKGKQIVRFSQLKVFMKKRTHIQIIPETKFCRFLNLTK